LVVRWGGYDSGLKRGISRESDLGWGVEEQSWTHILRLWKARGRRDGIQWSEKKGRKPGGQKKVNCHPKSVTKREIQRPRALEVLADFIEHSTSDWAAARKKKDKEIVENKLCM